MVRRAARGGRRRRPRESWRAAPAPSERHPLDRERIVVAAIAFIDEHGLPSLSMRRLGGVARGGGDVALPLRAGPGEPPRRGGRADRGRDAGGPRRPGGAPGRLAGLPAAAGPRRAPHGPRPSRRSSRWSPRGPPEAPWLRPPLRSLTWVEVFLDGLLAEGFSDDRRRRGLPLVHELPARPPAAGGRHARRGRRPARRPRRLRGRQRQEHRAATPRSTGSAAPWPRTTRPRSSRRRSRACSTGSRCCARRSPEPRATSPAAGAGLRRKGTGTGQ